MPASVFNIGDVEKQIAALGTTPTTRELQGGNTAYNTAGSISFVQIGKMVIFSGYTSSTVASTGVNGLFSSLPSPASAIRFPTTGGVSGNQYPCWEMRTDGGMRNYADVNGTAFCSGVYFTA